MARYIDYNYNQSALISINFQDQIQPGIFEHALHYLVDNKLDLSMNIKVSANLVLAAIISNVVENDMSLVETTHAFHETFSGIGSFID